MCCAIFLANHSAGFSFTSIVYLHHSSQIKSHKEVTKQYKSRGFLLFLLGDGRSRTRIREAKKLMDPEHCSFHCNYQHILHLISETTSIFFTVLFRRCCLFLLPSSLHRLKFEPVPFLSRQNTFGGLGLSREDDLFGLRSMTMNSGASPNGFNGN
jgi:hypothetical protein